MDKKPLIKQGWLRALLYLIVGIIISTVIVLASNFLRTGKIIGAVMPLSSPSEFLVAYLTNNIGFLLVALLMCLIIDRRSLLSLGFAWKGFESHAWSGFFIGILMLCVGSLVLMALKFIYFIGFAIDIPNLLINVLLFVVVAFVEETMFRGYLLNNLMQSMNKWIALGISALVFAMFHTINPNATVLSIIGIFIAGVLLGINYIYTKNLWFGIMLHFAWNFFQGPILGYEVSGIEINGLLKQTLSGPALWTGGSFGFEGSLLALLLQIVAIGLLIRRYEMQMLRLDKAQ